MIIESVILLGILALGTTVYTASIVVMAILTNIKIKEIELFFITIKTLAIKSIVLRVGLIPLGSSIRFCDENLTSVSTFNKFLLFSSSLIVTGTLGFILYPNGMLQFIQEYWMALMSPRSIGAPCFAAIMSNTTIRPLDIMGGAFLSLFIMNSLPFYVCNGGKIIGLLIGDSIPEWLKTVYLYFGVAFIIVLFGSHALIAYFYIVS